MIFLLVHIPLLILIHVQVLLPEGHEGSISNKWISLCLSISGICEATLMYTQSRLMCHLLHFTQHSFIYIGQQKDTTQFSIVPTCTPLSAMPVHPAFRPFSPPVMHAPSAPGRPLILLDTSKHVPGSHSVKRCLKIFPKF